MKELPNYILDSLPINIARSLIIVGGGKQNPTERLLEKILIDTPTDDTSIVSMLQLLKEFSFTVKNCGQYQRKIWMVSHDKLKIGCLVGDPIDAVKATKYKYDGKGEELKDYLSKINLATSPKYFNLGGLGICGFCVLPQTQVVWKWNSIMKENT